jgi:hypothetical protein
LGLAPGAAQRRGAAGAVGVKPEEVMATIERLADLKAAASSREEFDAKKVVCEEAGLCRLPDRPGSDPAPTLNRQLATDPPPRLSRRLSTAAPVEFASAACRSRSSFCRSTIVRDGRRRKIGESAELFDDHRRCSRASGRFQGAVTLVAGPVPPAHLNEWQARSTMARAAEIGWLSDDNGRYVFAFDRPSAGLRPGRLRRAHATGNSSPGCRRATTAAAARRRRGLSVAS